MTNQADRLTVVRSAIATLQPAAQAGEPWPLATSFGTEPEASWGPREVLAHVAEMLSFWLGELERIVDGRAGGAPVPFGRVADDDVRIGLIGRDRSLPLRVLFGRVDRGLEDWVARVRTLTEGDLAAVGLHPRLGEMTIDAFVERFITSHTEDHVVQLRETLAARDA